ncbi:MAG: esterase-like activity of phytase family protein, partial [Bacteroidales bacterium]|nr:esterase-like activity of phytase family protein [Bacteroidales bacterium]
MAVWADSVELAYYHLVAGAGRATASFEGPSLRDSVTYYASMPGGMPGDTLRGSALAGETFVLEHSSSFMRLSFRMPAGKVSTAIGLMPMSVQPLVMAEFLDSLSGSAELLLPFEPSDWSADAFAAMVVYADNTVGTSRLSGMDFQPGKGVEYRFEPVTVAYGDTPSSIAVEDKGQERLSVSAGQYSGITYIEGTRYAVVHDKSSGGGIHLFDIKMDASAGRMSVTATEAPGNSLLQGGRDNEGIVYLPSSATLLVSAESDQSIREYDLEGNPTGR